MADSRWMAGLVGLLLVVAVHDDTAAWEVQLHGDITTQAALVRLGDIATVQGIEPGSGESLSQIIVAAGPTRSHRRVLTSGDIRKTLEQRGIDLQQCQFTGVSRVVVSYGTGTSPAERESGNAKTTRKHTSPRNKGLGAGEQQPQHAAADQVPTGERTQVVVPVRAIGRGELLRASDVELRYVDSASKPASVVQRLEDVVGREARQALSGEQPLSARMLKQPLLVRKRDEVEVWVRCGAIQARRSAVALSDGTLGDMIAVDTNDGSKIQFNARVVDIRKVEVLANSTSVGRRSD
ncbi:MAG: flagellar basal body P-ring formation chaperone FlgA [Pirellulaceae bacterium]